MKKVIVGIDPGMRGALATIVDGELSIWDLEDCYKPTGTFNSLDPLLFIQLVASAVDYEYEPEDVAVFCEESQTFHRDGIKTARTTFDSRGVIRTLFCSRGYKVEYIDPKMWKKHFGLLNTDKSESVRKACELFPAYKDFFTKPKRGGGTKLLDGRAEAALIALFGLQTLTPNERKSMTRKTKTAEKKRLPDDSELSQEQKAIYGRILERARREQEAEATGKTKEPKTGSPPRTVIGQKRVRRKYSLSDDYKAWIQRCDELKAQAVYHGSEAKRLGNEWKKLYENKADGFCNARDDREWQKANNLITISEMMESERANAWKPHPVEKLDLPGRLIKALQLEENKFKTVEDVSEWINRDFRKAKKGISKAAVETIRDALCKFIAPYHEQILDEQIEQARKKREELSA